MSFFLKSDIVGLLETDKESDLVKNLCMFRWLF